MRASFSCSLERGRPILVPARVRHRFEWKTEMLLDTGARASVITPRLAQEVGFGPDEIKPTTTAVGAGGAVPAAGLVLPRVSVDGIAVHNLRVICLALPPELGFDGILGLDFLGNFNIEINNEAETVSMTRWTAEGASSS